MFIPSTWTEMRNLSKTKIQRFTPRPKMFCVACKTKIALYIVGGLGYCREHKEDGIAILIRTREMLEQKRTAYEQSAKQADRQTKKKSAVKKTRKFGKK